MIETILRVNSLGLAIIVVFIGALGYALGLATKGQRPNMTVYLVWTGYENVEAVFVSRAEAEAFVDEIVLMEEARRDNCSITACVLGQRHEL